MKMLAKRTFGDLLNPVGAAHSFILVEQFGKVIQITVKEYLIVVAIS